ncbi:PIN2/TERF1-interacting telomerase inhibitor 1 isoform X2 [Sceloporus undulatus]|uniref:PIN2/TERF1-interacting telomerase inhibitor 1 isoform X2 n=1 Tax=Sceloporus undulatus TaxID=8520 RepID=UPI001C4B6C80|nr:PIN2/TERF1-interacting telomerase inhibitor 1 isoform X2 [Sceloporus undulatus]
MAFGNKPISYPRFNQNNSQTRRKQKWSVDPRNSTWSKDESKFGQKMLEKMGWSKGKGLGAQEQGNTEHIRVQVKNNTLGLGASISHEDSWIAHQDDFNQLLAELNNTHGQEIPEAVPREEKKTFSLEEKSKTSRKRVHYVKFAKGKDLSSRSEDDLSCIFGKRQIKKKQDDVANADPSEETLKEEVEPPEQVDAGNTVTSTLTVQEYFARRMAKRKKAQCGQDLRSADPPPAIAEELACLETQRKKRKKEKEVGPENESRNAKTVSPVILGSSGEEEAELDTQKEKRKKRKKSKHLSVVSSLICNRSQHAIPEKGLCYVEASDAEDSDLREQQSKKKKKHKKLRKGEVERAKPNKKKDSS